MAGNVTSVSSKKFEPRSAAQNKRLHVLLGQLKFDDEAKADAVFEYTGGRTQHSSEMSRHECQALIDWLDSKLPASLQTRKRPRGKSLRNQQYKRQQTGVKKLVTGEHLAELRQWGVNVGMTAGQLISFNNRQIGKDWPVTTEQCNKSIEALKAMHKRGWKAGQKKEAA
jgi:hypothetical protein